MNKKENVIKKHPYLFAVLTALAVVLVIFAGMWRLSEKKNSNEAAVTDEYIYEPTKEERLDDLQYELPVTGTDEKGEAKELIPAGKEKLDEFYELTAEQEDNKKTDKKKKTSDKEKNADNGIVVEIEGDDSRLKPSDGTNQGKIFGTADMPQASGNSEQSGNETGIIPANPSGNDENKPGKPESEITPGDDETGDKPAPAPEENKSKPRIIQEGNKQDKELPLLSIE